MNLLIIILGLNAKWIYKWGIIGMGIKIAIVGICALLIFLIIKVFGNKSKKKTADSKDDLYMESLIVKKTNKKVVAMCIAVPFLVIGILISGVFALSAKYDFFYELTGSPGIYIERHENSKGSTWSVECTALTDGTLKKVINKDKKKLENLCIDNKSHGGTLTMIIQQGKLKKEYTIGNGQTELNIEAFSDESIRVAIEHKDVQTIDFSVEWK